MEICSACGGTGWEIITDNGFKTSRRCSLCFKNEKMKKKLASALIPSRYEHCTFENYNPLSPTQKKAKQVSIRFVEEYPIDTNAGLFFMGPCGVGKTHLAIATLRGLIDKGFSCIFYDFRDLLKKIQYSYNAESEVTEYEVLKPVLEKDILVLDELGSQKITSWIRDTITHIINRRYNDNKIIILTSNYLDNPPKTRVDEETLIDRIGIRLHSRLYEMCRIVNIEGKDFRQTRQVALQHHD